MNGDPDREARVTILTTCTQHGARVSATSRVHQAGGEITLDPPATDGCVIILDEPAAAQLRDLLGRWLGWPPVTSRK